MAKRKHPSEQRTRAKRPATREKADRAWQMKLGERLPLKAIGERLGMSPSGVHELLSADIAGHKLAEVEDYRKLELFQIEKAIVVVSAALESVEDAADVFDGARTIGQLVSRHATISGTVKIAPPVVMVNQFAQGPDVSRLDIEEIESLKRIQDKLGAPAIEAHGEVVDDGDRGR